MKRLPVALQLYSVREDCGKDFPKVLRAVREMGYEGVELAGFNGLHVSDLNAITKDLDLKIVSAHVDRAELAKDPLASAELYEALGCQYVAYPWCGLDELPGGEKYPEFVETTKKISRSLKIRGIRLLYHNHDHELSLHDDRTLLDNLLNDLGPEVIKLELDVCWCKYAGVDPARFLRDHKGCVPLIHLKDYTGTKEEKNFSFAPLGEGCQDLGDLLVSSLECGAEWLVVEQDEPSGGLSAMECAKRSIETLKELQK